jgi:hypothetical protein
MNRVPIGQRRWAIAEGYIPGWSHGSAPQLISHETVCLLNATDDEARSRSRYPFPTVSPLGLTGSVCRHAGHGMFVSTISLIPSRSLRIPILQASSNRMLRSSPSTRAWTHDRPSLPSSAPSPMPAERSGSVRLIGMLMVFLAVASGCAQEDVEKTAMKETGEGSQARGGKDSSAWFKNCEIRVTHAEGFSVSRSRLMG